MSLSISILFSLFFCVYFSLYQIEYQWFFRSFSFVLFSNSEFLIEKYSIFIFRSSMLNCITITNSLSLFVLFSRRFILISEKLNPFFLCLCRSMFSLRRTMMSHGIVKREFIAQVHVWWYRFIFPDLCSMSFSFFFRFVSFLPQFFIIYLCRVS